MYAKEYNFVPKRTQITGPDCINTKHMSCLNADFFDPNVKENILTVLLAKKSNRAEIDKNIKDFRVFNSDGIVAVDEGSANKTVEDFLGKVWYSAMQSELDDIGAETVEDLMELEKEDIEMWASKRKKLQKK